MPYNGTMDNNNDRIVFVVRFRLIKFEVIYVIMAYLTLLRL